MNKDEMRPPPLDLRFGIPPYVPSWDILRRMTESLRAQPVPVPDRTVEHVLDMGSFGCDDESDDEGEYGDYNYTAMKSRISACSSFSFVSCNSSVRGWILFVCFALFCLLVAAFRVKMPVASFKFVREKV